MWEFSGCLRMWLLLAIALPLTRALVHHLALAAESRDPSTRTAKAAAGMAAISGSVAWPRSVPVLPERAAGLGGVCACWV
jgi:hypothetical protein